MAASGDTPCANVFIVLAVLLQHKNRNLLHTVGKFATVVDVL